MVFNLLRKVDEFAEGRSESTLKNYVLDSLSPISYWIKEPSGEVSDPYETSDAEGFSPALVSLVYAKAYQWTRNEEYLRLASLTLKRTAHIIQTPIEGRKVFRDLFLAFFGLKSFCLIKDFISKDEVSSYKEVFSKSDFCYNENLNGQVLSTIHQLNLHLYRIRNSDLNFIAESLLSIKKHQSKNGFFNDGMTANTKPIGYHIFIFNLLADSLAEICKIERKTQLEQYEKISEILASLLREEKGFVAGLTAADHSFSMTERTREHYWTCGAYLAYWIYRKTRDSHLNISKHLSYWSQFEAKHEVPSVTPNSFSNNLRVGFEDYANAVQYIPLSLAFAALSCDLEASFFSFDIGNSEISLSENNFFCDEESGYAHCKSEGSSFAVSLHNKRDSLHGGYALTGGLFNLCLGEEKTRVIASPSAWPNAYSLEVRRRSINHEGWMCVSAKGDIIWPDNDGRDFTISQSENQLQLFWSQETLEASRQLTIDGSSLLSVWRLKPQIELSSFEVSIPIVLDDGSGLRDFKIENTLAELSLSKSTAYTFLGSTKWSFDLGTLSSSTSGLLRSIRMKYPGVKISPGEEVFLSYRLENKLKSSQINVETLLADWNIFSENPNWLSLEGSRVDFNIPQGKSAYLVSGGEISSFSAPPRGQLSPSISDGELYTIISELEISQLGERSQISFFWLNYDSKSRVNGNSSPFQVYSGISFYPVHTKKGCHLYRIAYRLAGSGTFSVNSVGIMKLGTAAKDR